MTTAQYISQNKDLRVRLENQRVARQISEDAYKEKIKELENSGRDKERQIYMLQEYIASREAAYDRLASEKAELNDKNNKLVLRCEKLQETVDVLTARLNRDSSNSSKPPASDGLKKVIRNRRIATGRKPGGQLGHQGHSLGISDKLKGLIDSGEIDVDVVEHGAPDSAYVSRYELDIRTAVIVKEHRFHQGVDIPSELNNPVNYGSNMKTMCVYLSTVGLVAAERVSDFIEDVSGGLLTPSKSTILAFQKEASSRLDNEIEAIRESVLDAPVVNTDETILKSTQRLANDGISFEESSHTTFSIYARTYSKPDATLITISSHKDIQSVKDDNILPQRTKPVVHDHDTKYYNFSTGKHGECNTHICRYLKDLLTLTKHVWLTLMIALLLKMLWQD